MNKRMNELKEKEKLFIRLDKLGNAKVFYVKYNPSQIELNILRWFNLHPVQKIADKLKINRSYVYATIKKFENIYTLSEIKNS